MTKKFPVIVLVILLLTGCSNHLNSETENSSPSLATESVDEKLQYKPTYENINKILDYNKEDVVKYLGNNYQIVMAGAEGVAEGYYYEQYDITIFFEDEEPYKIAVIDCGDLVDINGVRKGMTFQKINELLGEEEIMQDQDGEFRGRYFLRHEIGNMWILFGADDKELNTDDMSVGRVKEID